MKPLFAIWDYVIIFMVLLVSSAIGIYYRLTGGKQKTVSEYLLADKNMSIIPVTFSLMANFMSAVAIMGESSEIYTYGMQYIIINVSYLCFTPVAVYIYLPVFFRLQTTSVYEYLELRFGSLSRLCASVAYTVQILLYTGVVLYAPALTLEALMGINNIMATFTVGLVCTFYSTIGGIKAVLVNDVYQSMLMFAAVFSVIICGIIQKGSFLEIWKIAQIGKRTEFFNFNPDPTIRHTWFSLIFGGAITFLTLFGVNQTQIQRYLTVKNLKQAQKALWISVLLLAGLSVSTCIAGLTIYSKYYDCDPVTTNKITSADQLMPYYVVDSMGHISGLSGLFVAGIFSASLSTVASTLNSVSAVTLEDYLKPIYKKLTGSSLPEKKLIIWTKCLVFVYGLLCIAIAFLAQFWGGILQAALTIFGAIGGPVLGLFSLGMFTVTANEIGALTGLACGFIMSFWISFGGPKPVAPTLPVRDDCNGSLSFFLAYGNSSYEENVLVETNNSEYFWLYRLSYLYNGVIGLLSTLIVGYTVSILIKLLFDKKTKYINPNLFVFFIAKYAEQSNEKIKQVSSENTNGTT